MSPSDNILEFWKHIFQDMGQNELDELLLMSSWEDPDFVVQRFLKARNNDFIAAWKMLRACLRWRIDNDISSILKNGMHMIPLNLRNSMKNLYWRTDKDGDLVCYIRANLHFKNENTFEESSMYTIWSMEIGRRLRISDFQKTTIVFDLEGSSIENFDIASIKHFIKLLQDYYPEVLGKLLIKNAPLILKTMIIIMKPIITERTMKKIKFVNSQSLFKFINKDDIPLEYYKEGQFSLKSINSLKMENTESKIDFQEYHDEYTKYSIEDFRDIIINKKELQKKEKLKEILKLQDIKKNYNTTNPYQLLGILSKDWMANWNL